MYEELVAAPDEDVQYLNGAMETVFEQGNKCHEIFETELQGVIEECCDRYLAHLGGERKGSKIKVVRMSAGEKVGIAGTGLATGVGLGCITFGTSLIVAGVFAGKALLDAVTEVGMLVVQRPTRSSFASSPSSSNRICRPSR